MKKRNKIVFITIIIVLITTGVIFGNKKNEAPAADTGKQNFYITTQILGGSGIQTNITKTATVEAASDITISSQVAGRVTNILVNLGDEITQSSLLISLSDIAGSYAFGAERAALSVQAAQNSFEINQQNLLKQLQDAQLAYEKTLLSTNNSNLGNANSSANLQLKQLEQNLAKAELDYSIKLKADQQSLENFVLTAKNVYSDVNNLLLDVVDQSDKFLGYTIENAHLNDGFQVYIAVKNDAAKYTAEQKLAQLISLKNELRNLGDNITIDNINSYLSQYKQIVSSINEMTIAMKNVLTATTPGGTLTQAGLDGYMVSFSALQSKASGITSSITSQTNSISTFVGTYEDNQESLKKQIESLKTQIAISKKQIEEASKNSSYTLEQSKSNLDFIASTQQENLNSLRTALNQAQLAYQEAQFNLGKFSVSAPIAGTIKEVLVDKGQEVTPGTPLLTMVGNGKEVVVKMTADERMYVKLGQSVEVEYEHIKIPGNVSEIGTVADDTGNYPVKITINENAAVDIGMFVSVSIPLEQGDSLIPLNAVTIVDNNRGQVFVRNGTEIEVKTVTLGSVYGNKIELSDELPAGTEIILTDMTRYDPQNMTIQKK